MRGQEALVVGRTALGVFAAGWVEGRSVCCLSRRQYMQINATSEMQAGREEGVPVVMVAVDR